MVSVFGDGSVTFVEKQPVFFPGVFSGHINCSSLQYRSNDEGKRGPAGPRPQRGKCALRIQDLQEDPAQMGPGKDKKYKKESELCIFS